MPQKIVLVTGSTDGIGKQTALELARRGFRVLLHGRSPERGSAVLKELRAEVPGAELDYLNADLSSLAEVRSLAEQVRSCTPRLDVLINNAGVAMKERLLTADELETTFAVNHLAPFLLTHLLEDRLRASGAGRVITVSSSAHTGGKIEFDNLQCERSFDGWQAYCDSKLMNVLFTVELAARLAGSGVTANSLHPGVIATKMLRASFPDVTGAGPDEGAKTSVFLADSTDAAGVSGKYFRKMRPADASALADDPALRLRLWEVSAKLARI